MTRLEFRNRLCILTSIDMHELVEAGIIKPRDLDAWERFTANPYRWFVRADNQTADRLWALIERRANPALQAARAS